MTQENKPQQPQNLVVSFELMQAIANYLGTKPYVEVAPFMAAFQQLQPAPVAEPDIKPAAE